MPRFWTLFGKKGDGRIPDEGQNLPPWGAGMHPDLKQYFELADRLEDAPPIWRETIALELIRMAPKTIQGFKGDYAYRQGAQKRRARRGRRSPPLEPFALPGHAGFGLLATSAEAAGNYAYAIQLCEEAKKQGWAGDWDERIARCLVRASPR